MADLETLKRALKNADAAGDAAAAKKFADAIRAQQGGGASAPAAPVEDRAALAQMSAMTQDPGLAARDKMKAAYEASPWYKKAAIDAFDVPNLVAEGGSAHLLDKGVAAARAPFTDLSYEEELAKQRERVKQAQARQGPVLSTVADITGAMALPAARGGNLPFRLGAGAAEGAGYGAARSYADDQDVGTGALQGAGWGALGAGTGELVHGAARGAQAGWNALKNPRTRQELAKAATDAAWGAGEGLIYGQPLLGAAKNAAVGAYKRFKEAAPPPGVTQLDLFNAKAKPPPPATGAPDTRDFLSRLIARAGIWGAA